MARKRLRPEPPCQAATGPEMQPMPTACALEYSTFPILFQEPIGLAAQRLSRRYGLPPATAQAVAEANNWGRA